MLRSIEDINKRTFRNTNLAWEKKHFASLYQFYLCVFATETELVGDVFSLAQHKDLAACSRCAQKLLVQNKIQKWQKLYHKFLFMLDRPDT